MEDAVLQALERDEAYRLVRVLASNPSGTTELVQAQGREWLLVRKRIPLELANRDAWEALAGVRCSRLPQVVEMYELPDVFVVVCDYVEGTTLKALVSSVGKLGAEQCLGILENLCEAADALHARGVIHRDISPTNVIVAADGAHLIDLGIARMGGAAASHDTTRLGTFGFASPEQFGFAQTTARSDVYSLGCLAAYMLSGKAPDEEGFDQAIAQLDAPVRKVVTQARSFEPSKRYGSAPAFLAAFSQALGKAPRVDLGAAQVVESAPLTMQRPVRLATLDNLYGVNRDERKAPASFIILPSEVLDAWMPASVGTKVFTLLTGLLVLTFFLGVIGVGARTAAGIQNAGWKPLILLYFIVASAVLAAFVLEALCAVLKAGPYRTTPSRVREYLKRVLFELIAAVLTSFLIIVVGRVFFGEMPELGSK